MAVVASRPPAPRAAPALLTSLFPALLPALLLALPRPARAADGPLSPGALKRLSLEELMEVEVTTVTRQPERLAGVPSAIQVITREEIRRSGVATLPEALRLASNLQVAQINAREFAVSSRGFNDKLANKLLVMIDGRTVYTPLYAGVFWDAQHILLDNIERIEVISGPGGSVWGSNAVNGIINIVTLPAGETQGAYAEGSAGTFLRDALAARYGGTTRGVAWRVFGQRIGHGAAELPGGEDAGDDWDLLRGGFRADWQAGPRDRMTVHGELHGLEARQPGQLPGDLDVNGQIARVVWSRTLDGDAEIQARAHFDRAWRDIPFAIREDLRSYDFDVFHHLHPIAGNTLMWGLGYRLQADEVENLPAPPGAPSLAFLPARETLHLPSAYAQDEQALLADRLRIIVGIRLERNIWSGWEAMPSARIAWSASPRHTLWAAVSRAVRSPSRIDADFFAVVPTPLGDTLRLDGGPGIDSEKLHAYETGWRLDGGRLGSLSLSGFVHSYEDLRIVGPAGPGRLVVMNGLQGEIYGVELAGELRPGSRLRLAGGLTALRRDLYPDGPVADVSAPGAQGNDPAWHASLRSYLDLPGGFELNATARSHEDLPNPPVPGYFTLDLGAAWRWRSLEVSLTGRNLADDRHPEFASGVPADYVEIPRSLVGRIAWRP